MKLKEFMENMAKFLKDNPEALQYDVITSIDDEGNGFNPVYFEPSLGLYSSDYGEFKQPNYDDHDCLVKKEDCNAVCVN